MAILGQPDGFANRDFLWKASPIGPSTVVLTQIGVVASLSLTIMVVLVIF